MFFLETAPLKTFQRCELSQKASKTTTKKQPGFLPKSGLLSPLVPRGWSSLQPAAAKGASSGPSGERPPQGTGTSHSLFPMACVRTKE